MIAIEDLFFEGQCKREQSQACLNSAEYSLTSIFYQLLQVAIGNRKSLSRKPTVREWSELYGMATRQALMGVCFLAIQRLQQSETLDLPETLRLRWLGMAAKIQQRNKVVNSACVELVKQYTHDGLACCILKGQGNLVNYKTPSSSPCLGGGLDDTDLGMYRTPGDIDVWCWPMDPCGIEIAVGDLDGKGAHYETYHGKRALIEYVKMQHRIAGTEPHEGVRYHHIDAPDKCGISVEAHFRPLFLDSPLRNYRLQKWFFAQSLFCFGAQASIARSKENELFGMHDAKIGDYAIPTPTLSFNAVYQLCHIYRHLFDEGIGLRQLLDYYFVLRSLHIEQRELADRTESMAEGMGISVASNVEIMHQLSRFGLKKFAGAVMFVLQEVFAMPSEYMICAPDEKEGRFLLKEIMLAGNFGKYDQRIKHGGSRMSHAYEKTKHNLRLLRHYPEEVIFEPLFRVYHYIWRKLRLWRF